MKTTANCYSKITILDISQDLKETTSICKMSQKAQDQNSNMVNKQRDHEKTDTEHDLTISHDTS